MSVDLVDPFVRSILLIFGLLNPFLMSIYLVDLIQELTFERFSIALCRAGLISGIAFALFACLGDAIFTNILQVRFASFLIFGGIIFLVIGIRFVFGGSETLQNLRGSPEDISGSIAMPFMIGPGTLSASVLAGQRLNPVLATVAIALAMILTVVTLVWFKWLHDRIKQHNSKLVERYIDITGRIMALIIGSIAIEMILNGLEIWLKEWM